MSIDGGIAELRAVIVAMDNERLAAGEEKKVLEMGEHRAVVYPDTLRRAQRALRVGGHYDGDINGKFDPATHSAIIKFQTAKGIPVSGLPGPITLWALLVEKWCLGTAIHDWMTRHLALRQENSIVDNRSARLPKLVDIIQCETCNNVP